MKKDVQMLKQNIKGEEIYKGLERGRERDTQRKRGGGGHGERCAHAETEY